MTTWDNFLFSLIVLFLLPFAVLLASFVVSKVVARWSPAAKARVHAKPKRVREPIRPAVEDMGFQQAS